MTAAQRSTSCRFIEEVQMGSTRSKQRFNAKGKGKKKKSTLKNKKKKMTKCKHTSLTLPKMYIY